MHAWRAVACQCRPVCNDANGWKLITAHLIINLNGGPFLAMGDHLAAKTGPPRPILVPKFGLGGPVLAKFLPKSVRGDRFWCDRASRVAGASWILLDLEFAGIKNHVRSMSEPARFSKH